MITYIRSVIFTIFFFFWSALLSIGLIPLTILPSRFSIYAGRAWEKGLINMIRIICGVKYKVEGKENLPPEGQPCILVSKHQSAWETIIFFGLFRKPSYILKKELVEIPMFGRHLIAMDMIGVDRSAGISALKKMSADVKDRLAKGCTIIIFPEGTRTAPGAEPKYHSGIAHLYGDKEITAPFIPVALNSGYFWGKNSLLKKPGTITLRYLKPIEKGLSKKAFMEQVQNVIEDECKKIRS